MKHILFILFLSASVFSFAQIQGKLADRYTHFQLVHKKDTIDFVVADTSLTEKKPILLFCQGSRPTPLFIDAGEQGFFPVTLDNFDVTEMKKRYHVVVISMPNTPVVAKLEELNRSFSYVVDTADQRSYVPEYVESDYLENYVNRGNRVLKFLSKQKWVEKEELVVAGHSQGSRVAVGIAHSNKHVTKLGLFGYNPQRRIDQQVWSIRKQAQKEEISWELADSLQQNQYAFYEEILNPDSLAKYPMYKSWKSFSVGSVDEVKELKIPVYIAFGSEDDVAEYCDLLPLDFAETGKKDYILVRYPNLDHNFFPMGRNGRPDYNEGKWVFVMNAFIKWTDN